MFEGKSILDILQIGGATMYVLLLCSVVSIAIFLERIVYYRKQSRRARISEMSEEKTVVLNV
jgi:biopolymer transport protein ExbB/TolQ